MENMKLEDVGKIEIVKGEGQRESVKVTIWCVTYNHRDYIEKALNGFVKQKTKFNYEVLVFDDASTDGTSDIVRQYVKKYPEIIKGYLAHTNTYNHPDRKRLSADFVKAHASGKYIAFCEGDDYWIYDYKLQKQYDWMESYPNTSLCVHNAIRYDEQKKEVLPQIMDMDSQYLDPEEVFFCRKGRVPAASYFFRKEYWDTLPSFYDACPVGDEPLRWWLTHNGDVYYMDKVWSVRNYMHDGSWNKKIVSDLNFYQNYLRRFEKSILLADEETNYRFHKLFEERVTERCLADVGLVLPKNYTIYDLQYRIEECIKNSYPELEKYYREAYGVYKRGSQEYLNRVFEVAKENNDNFYIYGAGIEARKYAQIIWDRGIDFKGFVVSKRNEDAQRELMGKPIYEYKSLLNKLDSIFWLCMNYKNREEVATVLTKEGITQYW